MSQLPANAFVDARIKLFRAYEHIVAFRAFTEQYGNGATYQIRREYVALEDKTLISVAINPLPGNMSAMAGDAAANLWQACSALWGALLQYSGLPANAYPFPIGRTADDVKAMIRESGLSEVSPEAGLLFAETIRPYRDGNGYLEVLERLHRFNDRRLLPLAAGAVRMMATQWRGQSGHVDAKESVPVSKEGPVFRFPMIPGDLHPTEGPQIQFQIHFAEAAGVGDLPVIGLLTHAANGIKMILDRCEDRLVGVRSFTEAE